MRHLLFTACLFFACGEPAIEALGLPIDNEPFDPVSAEAGIYPSNDVMDDPNNYFAGQPPSETAKWDIQSYGDPKLSYYAFASALTRVPTGENQFYVAVNLATLSRLDYVVPSKRQQVRNMAVLAFQTVIDLFPNDLTYDADGVTAYSVAEFAESELAQFLAE